MFKFNIFLLGKCIPLGFFLMKYVNVSKMSSSSTKYVRINDETCPGSWITSFCVCVKTELLNSLFKLCAFQGQFHCLINYCVVNNGQFNANMFAVMQSCKSNTL